MHDPSAELLFPFRPVAPPPLSPAWLFPCLPPPASPPTSQHLSDVTAFAWDLEAFVSYFLCFLNFVTLHTLARRYIYRERDVMRTFFFDLIFFQRVLKRIRVERTRVKREQIVCSDRILTFVIRSICSPAKVGLVVTDFNYQPGS